MEWKRVPREYYRQLIFVFAAFLMMVLVSYFSIKTIAQNQIEESARGALRIAESNIVSGKFDVNGWYVGMFAPINNL